MLPSERSGQTDGRRSGRLPLTVAAVPSREDPEPIWKQDKKPVNEQSPLSSSVAYSPYRHLLGTQLFAAHADKPSVY